MAKMVLTTALTSINSNDLSDHCSKVELAVHVEDKDVTTFASSGWKESLGGLKSGTLSLTFKQDVAAAALDSIIWPLLGTVVPFEVRLTSSARSTSNPGYTGSVLIKEWTPLSGSPGDVAESSVSWTVTGAVTRATS